MALHNSAPQQNTHNIAVQNQEFHKTSSENKALYNTLIYNTILYNAVFDNTATHIVVLHIEAMYNTTLQILLSSSSSQV